MQLHVAFVTENGATFALDAAANLIVSTTVAGVTKEIARQAVTKGTSNVVVEVDRPARASVSVRLMRGAVEAAAQTIPAARLTTLLRSGGPVTLAVADKAPVRSSVDRPAELNGRVFIDTPSSEDSFTGWHVSVAYNRSIPGASHDDVEAVLPGHADAPVDARGEFSLTVPSAANLKRDRGVVALLSVRGASGDVLANRDVTADDLKQRIDIHVRGLPLPIALRRDPAAAMAAAQPKRLRGKVVDLTAKHSLAGTQAVIFGRQAGQDDGTPVAVATTDGSGNFSCDYPTGTFVDAWAVVSAIPDHPVAIALAGSREADRSCPMPPFLYLAFDGELALPVAIDNDCDCAPTDVPRLPDNSDLTANSDIYSQDVGGACVNFTKPNRTLEESTYAMVVRTTEPTIRGSTLDEASIATLSIDEQKAIFKDFFDRLAAKKASTEKTGGDLLAGTPALWSAITGLVSGRSALSTANPIDWDGSPTFYQATSIAHGHILTYKQSWKADGYSMGDLVYSLPLAPGQKKEIVVFDWDRHDAAGRNESESADDRLDAYLDHGRDINDIQRAVVSESVRGGSRASTSGTSGGIGGGIFGSFFGIVGGVASTHGSASSSAWQDSSRNVSASGSDQLREAVRQGASSVRNQRSTVIQTARQAESFKVQSEVVANHNHCHAVTIQFFEILRHYVVDHRLIDVQECLFVPLTMSAFDDAKILRWQHVLRPVIDTRGRTVASRIQPTRRLARGFDAIERIANHYEGSSLPTGSYAEEAIQDISGTMTVTFRLNRPRDADDEALEAARRTAIDDDARRKAELSKLNELSAPPSSLWSTAWAAYAELLGRPAESLYDLYFREKTVAMKDEIFEREVAPRLAERFVNQMVFSAVATDGSVSQIPIDATLVSQYRRDVPLQISLSWAGSLGGLTREHVRHLEISVSLMTDWEVGFAAGSTPLAKVIVNGANISYQTDHLATDLSRNTRINNDLRFNDPVAISTPLSALEKSNPRKDDVELKRQLIHHLNSNLEHYHKIIWSRMDPDRRYMLLDGILAPNGQGRSVASVVENRVIGVAGNSLIMPVAPGFKLDPTYDPIARDAAGAPSSGQSGADERVTLLEHYRPEIEPEPFRVSVPTRGVFAEAVQGACNSCEKKDDTRFWRWEESPNPDEPTPIQTVGTDSRRVDLGNLAPTPFAAPIVAFQNVPAAPDPGSALSDALRLAGTSKLFDNITGLDQNQKNALAAMLASNDAARGYADAGARLAIQGNMLKNADRIMETIKKAKADKIITDQQASTAGESLLNGLTGGKSSIDPAMVQGTLDRASTAKKGRVTLSAADGTGVTTEFDDNLPAGTFSAGNPTGGQGPDDQADGNHGVTPAEGTTVDFTTSPIVDRLGQPSDATCWAAAATAMLRWKTGDPALAIADAVAGAGSEFAAAFSGGQSLKRADKLKLISALGMVVDENSASCFQPSYLYQLLQHFGPLWSTADSSSDGFAPHARIIYGIHGDLSSEATWLRMMDPDGGKLYDLPISTFQQEYEDLAAETPSDAQLFIQLVRFPQYAAADDVGEGQSTSPSVPMAPVTTLMNSVALEKAVNLFKDVFKPDPTYFEHGQHYLTATLQADLIALIDGENGIGAGTKSFEIAQMIGGLSSDSLEPWKELSAFIKSHDLQTTFPKTLAAIDSNQSISTAQANAISDNCWGTIKKWVKPAPLTANTLLVVAKADSSRCYKTAVAAATAYHAFHHKVPTPLLGLDVLTAKKVSHNTNGTYDVLDYDPIKLKKMVAAIAAKVDAGIAVRTQVVSGLAPDNEDWFAHSEHYVLIIGRDDNQFVFFDPHSSASNIDKLKFGAGFGLFIYQNNRFTTALTDADLACDPKGDHSMAPQKRHRYQPFRFFTA